MKPVWHLSYYLWTCEGVSVNILRVFMKKAVISTGGKQYVVAEGETLDVEVVAGDKTISFEALLIVDGDSTKVGTPTVEGSKVSAEILDQVRADKVTAIRYKAKKRVHKLHGHKQHLTRIKISKIS